MVTGIGIRGALAAFVVLALAAGCGVKNVRNPASIQDLDIDPAFTWSKVESHQIGVLAVTEWSERLTWTEPIMGRQLRDTLLFSPLIIRTQKLSHRVAYHNPQWNVVSTTELADSLGWKSYTRLVDSYARSGYLSEDELALLGLSLRERLRYVLLARIEDHQTGKWENYDEGADETDYTAVRALVLDYKIYDLWYGDLVWSGWVEEEEMNESSVSETEYEYDEEASVLANVLGGLLSGLISGPRPDVPGYEGLLDDSFANLAQNLFPPVPFLCEGPPDNTLRCSLCPDLPGRFQFGERTVTLRLDDEKIYMQWADGSETRLRKGIDDWPGEVRCSFCGSLYNWESEWMTLASEGLPE
jgi:hypothetical protein